MVTTATAAASMSLHISSDPAGGHNDIMPKTSTVASENANNSTHDDSSILLRLFGKLFRWVLMDLTLTILFALMVGTVLLHRLHDDYLYPQLRLMQWQEAERNFMETTYYHRRCTVEDFTAKSLSELIVQDHFSSKDSMEHMLTHGVSVYPNLLTNETAWDLRDWIDKENKVQEGWHVIKPDNRYSWGIDMNMHPKLQTFWQELASNKQFVEGLEAVVGPDPAVIEFTAITSSYGAADQHDHADVVPPGSGTKFARSFVPSYSLFIPLQDTTYDMGKL
jgi:hypothetical protein